MFVLIIGLVALALAGLFIVPHFWDWSQYREAFEKQATQLIGMPVSVAGDTNIQLLPTPKVEFSAIKIGADDTKLSGSIERFEMDIELAPLLKGEVQIIDMRLVRPHAVLRVTDDAIFDIPIAESETPVEISKVVFENVSVLDGKISLIDEPAGRVLTTDNIQSNLSARSLAGPWRATGEAVYTSTSSQLNETEGGAFNFRLNTGSVQDDGGFRTRLLVEPQTYPLIVEIKGDTLIEDGVPSLRGTFDVKQRVEEDIPAAKDPNFFSYWAMSGELDLSLDAVTSEEFELRLADAEDPYKVTGTAEWDFTGDGRFQVIADGEQADLKRFAKVLPKTNAQKFSARLDGLRSFINTMPNIARDGLVSLTMPALVMADTSIRDVAIEARPRDGDWQIDTFNAQLAGRTQVKAAGLLKSKDDFVFDGSLVLASNQPSGFAALFQSEIDPAIRSLSRAGLAADINISGTRQNLSNIELDLDGALLKGRIENRSANAADTNGALDIQLEGGVLNVDALNALTAMFGNSGSDGNAQSSSSLKADVKVAGLKIAGLSSGPVDAAFSVSNDRLSIERMNVSSFAGLNVTASGQLDNWKSPDQGDLKLAIEGDSLAPAFKVLLSRFPQWAVLKPLAIDADLTANSEFDLTISQSGNSVAAGTRIVGSGEIGGTLFSLSSLLPLSSGNGGSENRLRKNMNLDLRLTQSDTAQLFRQIGIEADSLPLLGTTRVDVKATGQLASGLETTLVLRNGDDVLNSNGKLVLEKPLDAEKSLRKQFNFDQKIDATFNDVGPYSLMLGHVFPDQVEGLSAGLKGTLLLENGRYELRGGVGNLNNNIWSGDLLLSFDGRRPELSGDLGVTSVSLPVLAQYTLGQMTTVSSFLEQSETVFGEPTLTGFDAQLKLRAQELDFGLGSPATKANLNLRLDDGGITLDDIDAKLGEGNASGYLSVVPTGRGTAMEARVQVTKIDLGQLFGEGRAIVGTGDVSIDMQATGQSPKGIIAEATGTGSASIDNLKIDSINVQGLSPLLQWADGLKEPPETNAIEQQMSDILPDGSLSARSVAFPFSIAAGTLRANTIILQNQSASLTAEAKLDLNTRQLDAQGTLNFEPGRNAVAGASPEIDIVWRGPVQKPQQDFNVRGLVAYLGLRAFEREQRRVELLQARILENQRLRRETRYYKNIASVDIEREKTNAEQQEKQAEEEAALKAAEEERAVKPVKKDTAPAKVEKKRVVTTKKADVLPAFDVINIDPVPQLFTDNPDRIFDSATPN